MKRRMKGRIKCLSTPREESTTWIRERKRMKGMEGKEFLRGCGVLLANVKTRQRFPAGETTCCGTHEGGYGQSKGERGVTVMKGLVVGNRRGMRDSRLG